MAEIPANTAVYVWFAPSHATPSTALFSLISFFLTLTFELRQQQLFCLLIMGDTGVHKYLSRLLSTAKVEDVRRVYVRAVLCFVEELLSHVRRFTEASFEFDECLICRYFYRLRRLSCGFHLPRRLRIACLSGMCQIA